MADITCYRKFGPFMVTRIWKEESWEGPGQEIMVRTLLPTFGNLLLPARILNFQELFKVA